MTIEKDRSSPKHFNGDYKNGEKLFELLETIVKSHKHTEKIFMVPQLYFLDLVSVVSKTNYKRQ